MKKIRFIPFILLIVGCSSVHNEFAVDPKDGHIEYIERNGDTVRFRKDSFRGPSFLGLTLDNDGKGNFRATKGSLSYNISYRDKTDDVVADISITNIGDTDVLIPLTERLILGIDMEMHRFPQWDSVMSPTLLRCEKDFVWGYFSSPTGRILAFATEEPVASYNVNYRDEGKLNWVFSHIIYTASIDLLHRTPLPKRHPQHLDRIAAGQTINWTLHMGMVDNLEDVKPFLVKYAHVPMMELDSYTVSKGSKVKIECLSSFNDIEKVIITPSGLKRKIEGNVIDSLYELGLYTIQCTSNSKTIEGSLYVRPEWNWYSKNVREYLAKYPPRVGESCEQYYGYLPVFNIARRIPDYKLDSILGYHLEKQLSILIDTIAVVPYPRALPTRMQNFSTLAVSLARYGESSGKIEYVKIAGKLGDYMIKNQTEDGAYRNNKTHYTCVIYPAKSMFDLAEIERRIGMNEEADRHEQSAMKACLDLLKRLDNIETEGEMTFEDGMIACSTLQLAYAALHTDDTNLKARFTEAAEYMRNKHKCLEQLLVPDCRMRGATLRWWEALDIYFTPNQCMESPHGWSAWTSYALYYLYKLTGKEIYRTELNNLLGSCAQIMELNGNLRWGFIVDPYLDARVCVPSETPGQYTTVSTIVGEQYMELISSWCRPEDPFTFTPFSTFGGEGDGTVYEIFNSIEELIQDGYFVD